MQSKTSRFKRATAILLALLLVLGSSMQAFALSGTITNRSLFTFTEVGVESSNYNFTLEGEDGNTYVGTCMEPHNQTIPEENSKVTMTKCASSSMRAKIAYLGYKTSPFKELSSSERRYIISRAAARAAGNIAYNEYSKQSLVNELYDKADARTESIPDDFVVYTTADSDPGQKIIAWRTIKGGSLDLEKSSDAPGSDLSLAGAKYGVYETRSDANGNKKEDRIAVLTTKSDGSSNKVTLPEGTYYVREYLAPDGFELDEDIHVVEISDGKSATVKSEEPFTPGKISVVKTSSIASEYDLEGAKYGVYTSRTAAKNNDTDKRVGILTTEADGTSNIVEVEPGKTYYVKEYRAPEHYQLEEEIHEVYVDYGLTSVIKVKSTDMPNPGYVKVQKKTEMETSYSKAGAKYGVYTTQTAANNDDESKRKAVLTTDADGNTPTAKLDPGTYYVKEIEAPANLELDEEIYKVVLSSDETETVHSTEPVSTGWAKVKKVTASNSHLAAECPEQYSLAGAQYGVYITKAAAEDNDTSKREAVLTTDANGNTPSLELIVGTYYIKEIKRSKGYDWDREVHTVKVTRNQTATVTSEEPPLFAPITIVLDKAPGNSKEHAPSLAKAEFTVKYYKESTDDVSGLNPARTWKFKTVMENGKGVIGLRDDYKIGGDELYKDDNGIVVGLIGTYVITETKAPAGYIIDPTPKYAHVKENGNATNPQTIYNQPTVPNDPKEFRLQLIKLDGETAGTAQGDADLSGAVFGLYRNGEEIGRYTTDKNYSFTTEYFNIGDGSDVYTVKELSSPTGYLLNSTPYRLSELEGDKITQQYTTVNLEAEDDVFKGRIAITKILNAQSVTGGMIPEVGIDFEVYLKSAGSYAKAKDTEKQIITTDAAGYAETKGLPYGIYTVHQVNTTDGHEKIADFDVFVSENGKTYRYTINNDEIDRPVKVSKVDSETGKVILAAGTKFKIRKAGTEDEWISFTLLYPQTQVIDIFETDASGTFQLPGTLSYGQYELVEQSAPEGYVLSSALVPFTIDGTVDLVEVTQENDPQKGTIEITKTGEVLKSVIANADGTYTPVYGEGVLSGAVFEIFAKEDVVTPDGTKRYIKGEKVDTVTTDADGKAVSKELYLGKYEVKEVNAPENHVLNDTVFTAELIYAGQEVKLTSDSLSIDDERQKAEVSLVKSLETDELYGCGKDRHKDIRFGIFAEKEITAEDGSSIPAGGMVESIGVTEDGDNYSGTFDADLPHGEYYVQEVETSEGYILGDAKYAVDFTYKDQDTAVVSIHVNNRNAIDNEIIRGSITGHKADEDGSALAGALMGLFKADETVFTEETALQTDTSGLFGGFKFKDIPYGKYIVREIKAPIGFALNKTSYEVTIDEDGEDIEVDVTNEITKFDIAKTDIATGDYVIGAQLSIIPLDAEGNPDVGATLESWLTEEKEHRVEGLEVGKTYILREKLTGAARDAGYVTAEDIVFTVEDTGKVQKLEMKDDFTKIEILKTDIETGDQIEGATLQIIKLDGTLVTEFESTDKESEITHLPVGEYILRETKAPAGYVKAEDMKFTVTDTAAIQTFEMKDDYIKVSILKKDAENKKVLPGAKLQLLDENGDKITTWISSKEAMQFDRLPTGTYTLKEVKAPEGYKKAETLTFTVEETAEVQEFIMVDDKIVVLELTPEKTGRPKIPDTGDDNHPLGWMIVAILGIGSLVVGTRRKDI